MNCPNCRITIDRTYKARTRTCPACLAAEPCCDVCHGFGFVRLERPDDLCPCCGTWLAGDLLTAEGVSVDVVIQ